MSGSNLANKLNANGSRAPPANHNPFTTAFDDEVSDSDDWWDEEDTTPPPQNEKSMAALKAAPPTHTSDNTTGLGLKTKPRTNVHGLKKTYSVQKPMREKSRARQKKQNAEFGIRVVTNFSRQQDQPIKPQQQQAPPPNNTQPNAGCFVDLAALRALTGEPEQTSRSFWRPKRKPSAKVQVKTTVASQEGAPRGLAAGLDDNQTNSARPRMNSDLSPNDRPIVIGICIPSNNLAEHTLSPQTAATDVSNITESYGRRNDTNAAPDTPTIIITPAQERSHWLAPSSQKAETSVYNTSASGLVIPLELDDHQRREAEKSCFSPDSDDDTTFGEDEDDVETPRRSRIISTSTRFDDNESPIMTRSPIPVSPAPAEVESQESLATKHASMSTIGTRRRLSRGWWNVITTPFMSRVNTFARRDVDSQQPPIPSLALAAAKAGNAERGEQLWEKQFSPLTPETSTTTNSDTWWNPGLRGENAKEQTPKIPQRPLLVDREVQTSAHTSPSTESPRSGMFAGFFMSHQNANIQNNGPATSRSLGVSTYDGQGADGSTQVRPQDFIVPDLPVQGSQSGTVDRTGGVRDIQSSPSIAAQSPPPPPYSSPPARARPYHAIFPPGHAMNLQGPTSPGPISPGLQRAISSGGAIQMSEVPVSASSPIPRAISPAAIAASPIPSHAATLTPASSAAPTPQPSPRALNLNSGYPVLPPRQSPQPVTTEFAPPPANENRKIEKQRRRYEKEDAMAHKAGGLWRGRGCIPERGCYGRKGPEGRKRRRAYCWVSLGLICLIVIIIALATTLHRHTPSFDKDSQWLNLTGFPPIFLGLSTVAAPTNIVANSGCVNPATQWSCALPKELQGSVAPNQPNQPNFLLQIQWDNSSATNATFANVTGNPSLVTRSHVGNAVSAGQLIKRILLQARQAITFNPNPAPPSFAEETFLGETTDGIVSDNKAGEPTPFYISFLSPTNATVGKRELVARASNSSNQFPNISSIIPPPSLNSDKTAAPANLLPFPSQQPIRLYDRGLNTEHYGFYTYFDRAIFLKSLNSTNSSSPANGSPDDENGGALESEAAFRCTWAQTRFLVQMWTRMNTTSQLLNSSAPSTITSGIQFERPGSFPYPVTITTDRHGGDPSLKMIYCYGMNSHEGIIVNEATLSQENRGIGGTIVNPAPGLFSNTTDVSGGVFDGGSGGCSCSWSNFQKVTNT